LQLVWSGVVEKKMLKKKQEKQKRREGVNKG
jgi:hypothetical protein